MLNNSYMVGSVSSQRLDHMQMLLPLVLHPSPKRVAAIGLGAGFTAEAALLDPAVERLDAVEISPSVLTLCREGLGSSRAGLFTDPRSHVHLADGRTFLMGNRGRFDVVIGDFYVPWREGIGRLYSREYFQTVSAALADGGLYCQCLPLYQMEEDQFHAIGRTFLDVFPDAWVGRNSFAFKRPGLALLGRKGGPVLSAVALASRCADLADSGTVANAFLHDPEGVYMHLLGPLADFTGTASWAVVNTLDNGYLEQTCSWAIMQRGWSAFTAESWQDVLTQRLEAGPLGAPADVFAGMRVAQLWLDLQGRVASDGIPAGYALAREAAAALPHGVVGSPSFSWLDLLMDVPVPIPRAPQAPRK